MKNLMTRRDALKLGAMALAGSSVWPLKVKAQGKANPRGTAKNCIVIELAGCISPQDTWDFKEHWRQPKDLDVRKTKSGMYLSKTLFPQLSEHTDKVSFVRSMKASELTHFNGQYHTQTGRALNPALGKEIPAFGSIIAYELEPRRRESDTFPIYFSAALGLGSDTGPIGSGFLPARFAGVDLNTKTAFDTFGAVAEGSNRAMEHRFGFLSRLSEASMSERESLGSKQTDFRTYYHDAYRILTDARWDKVFQTTDEEKKRYGAGDDYGFGFGLILAKNLIAADAGTRFVFVHDENRWDFHTRIFDRNAPGNEYTACERLDKGFVSLMTDLAAMPGSEPGKTLLDETLIVTVSEFGRTPDINPVMGRHHWPFVYTTMFAGGGVKGGNILGSSDEVGGYCVETGWKHKEQPWMDNTVATIYSALGIDWKKTIHNTPSGRAYEYIQTAPVGGKEFISGDAIDELFA